MAIIFVHGTWSRNKFSRLKRHLTDQLQPSCLHLFDFAWRGQNRIWSRLGAADRLAELLSSTAADGRFRRCVVIAHSHGGNVAVQAIEAAQLLQHVPLYCLATPFLTPVRRRITNDDRTLGNLAGGLFWAITFALGFSLQMRGHGGTLTLWMAAALALVTVVIMSQVVESMRKWAERAVLPFKEGGHRRRVYLHIYRIARDEPRFAFRIVGIIDDFVNVVWRGTLLTVQVIGTVCRFALPVVVILAALMYVKFGHNVVVHIFWQTIPGADWLWHWEGLPKLVRLAGAASLAVMWWKALPDLATEFGKLIAFALSLPFVAMLFVIMLPFGIDASLISLFYDVHVRDYPDHTTYDMTEVPGSFRSGLSHFFIYNHPLVLSDMTEKLRSDLNDSCRRF